MLWPVLEVGPRLGSRPGSLPPPAPEDSRRPCQAQGRAKAVLADSRHNGWILGILFKGIFFPNDPHYLELVFPLSLLHC